MTQQLKGKTAVITGGNSGIGLATAKRFVEEGAYIYITGRRQDALDRAVKEIGSHVTAVQADVAEAGDMERLYGQIKADGKGVDILFANAGIVEAKTLGEIDEDNFDKQFNTNVRGVVNTVQKALPILKDGGSIIITGSLASDKGMLGYDIYGATKAAVKYFAKTWALALKGRNIRVNTIAPGPIDTPIMDSQAESPEKADALREQFASMVPLGRLGNPLEVANTVLFLASDASTYITGVNLAVDGGMAAA